MLEQYISAAIEQATCEYLADDQVYYCEISDLPGIWSSGDSRDAALQELRTVVADWVDLGLQLDQPIPVLNGIDLNTQRYQHA